jgi:hypothetical protein
MCVDTLNEVLFYLSVTTLCKQQLSLHFFIDEHSCWLFLSFAVLKTSAEGLGAVAHTCNPSYEGCRGQEYRSWKSFLAKKVHETISQPIKSWVWWCMPIIPATQET